MSVIIELLAKNLADNFEMLKNHLGEFSDAEMFVRPVAGANHAAWQVGHLLFFENMVCSMYAPSAVIKLPDGSDKLYGKEGATVDDAAKFLSKEELLKHLGTVRQALVTWVKGLSDDDLAKAGPDAFKGWVDTIGDLVIAIQMHTTMHIGQIQVIRRKLGKKVMF